MRFESYVKHRKKCSFARNPFSVLKDCCPVMANEIIIYNCILIEYLQLIIGNVIAR